MPPRPGRAAAGIATGISSVRSTCASVAWTVRTGTAGNTCCEMLSASCTLAPSPGAACADTSHLARVAAAGTR